MTEGIDPKALREDRGWTQAQMADYLGCDQATVSRMERGASISGPVERLLRQLTAQPETTPTSTEAA